MTAWPPLLVFTISTFFFSALTMNERKGDETALLGVLEEKARKMEKWRENGGNVKRVRDA